MARRDTDTLSFVYALVVTNIHMGVNAIPEYSPTDVRVEISAFKNVAKANMYFETANFIMEQQRNGAVKSMYNAIRDWPMVTNHINSFNKMAMEFKTKTK